MKALALSSRPVFVVCDKEKFESCLEKKNSVNDGDMGIIIIKMERFLGFSSLVSTSFNFEKKFFIFFSQKIKSLEVQDSCRV